MCPAKGDRQRMKVGRKYWKAFWDTLGQIPRPTPSQTCLSHDGRWASVCPPVAVAAPIPHLLSPVVEPSLPSTELGMTPRLVRQERQKVRAPRRAGRRCKMGRPTAHRGPRTHGAPVRTHVRKKRRDTFQVPESVFLNLELFRQQK